MYNPAKLQKLLEAEGFKTALDTSTFCIQMSVYTNNFSIKVISMPENCHTLFLASVSIDIDGTELKKFLKVLATYCVRKAYLHNGYSSDDDGGFYTRIWVSLQTQLYSYKLTAFSNAGFTKKGKPFINNRTTHEVAYFTANPKTILWRLK